MGGNPLPAWQVPGSPHAIMRDLTCTEWPVVGMADMSPQGEALRGCMSLNVLEYLQLRLDPWPEGSRSALSLIFALDPYQNITETNRPAIIRATQALKGILAQARALEESQHSVSVDDAMEGWDEQQLAEHRKDVTAVQGRIEFLQRSEHLADQLLASLGRDKGLPGREATR